MQNKKTVWKLNKQIDEAKRDQLASELGRSKTFAELCLKRGLETKEAVEQFITPSMDLIGDPFLFYDMEKAVERIMAAVGSHEQITVYGDYDADGVTSTAILYEAIELLGGQVDYFIPNRFKEGYGPNVEAFDQLIDNGTHLIVTVDNGVSGHEAISHARSRGVDVIVTDHHECPDVLPEAYAVIHPRHPEQHYTTPDLSGAGVSMKMAQALLGENSMEFLELAAIGTIADLVSLTGENRAIAYYGLKVLQQTQRLGLIALMQASNIKPESVDEETVGFQLAPPINAVGRLGDASLVVDLLTTFDEEKALKLSNEILAKNNERKAIVEAITEEAMIMAEHKKNQSLMVLAKKNWHEGVLGIVASKITEKFHKPVLVLTVNEAENKIKGSGRSIEGFNLYECVNDFRDKLQSFGGHEMACGLSLDRSYLSEFTEEVNKKAEQLSGSLKSEKTFHIATEIDWRDIDTQTIEDIEQLKPFGQDNTKPLVKIGSVFPENTKKIGANQTHFKATLQKDDSQLDMIAFNSADWSDILKSSPEIDIIGYLSINEWNGFRKVQLQALDYKSKEPLIIDQRKSAIQDKMFKASNVHFIFFQKAIAAQWTPRIDSGSTHQIADSESELKEIPSGTPIIIVDTPEDVEHFKSIYQTYQSHPIYLYFHSPNDYYLKGMPKKQHFQKLYKWLMKKQEVVLSKDTKHMVKSMNLDKDTLKFMLMVFLENEFVTMEDGKLSLVSNPSKKQLEDTLTYKKRLKQIEAEEVLVYSSFKELLAYLKK
ncbi:single-stranded-DNA-specific exonuclease [Alkalibacterium putridalgicola]|uniref:Single-stranded-DNA-specific exonuclease RecJ n=1 Tax=Alkalibacterium putridalgicola TaxID=426703 RepID=A0A1H7PWV4_9LACT|nr:single-stranded-DNA-specific exonuclease RecJ [Alkalibacterium putridalgicola]GEK88128.1 single-stranded-DNA-specific exonuclease RecJ [Alkalibacterium putridalgicola]SEL39948.1 single-stranded-DNA-specific exonuclease [Alkalibacterium putridalgicola]